MYQTRGLGTISATRIMLSLAVYFELFTDLHRPRAYLGQPVSNAPYLHG
jgi:hypothetical protein